MNKLDIIPSKLFAIYNAADLIEGAHYFEIEIQNTNELEIIAPKQLMRLIGMRGIWAITARDERDDDYMLRKTTPKITPGSIVPEKLGFILANELGDRANVEAEVIETKAQLAHGDVPFTLEITQVA